MTRVARNAAADPVWAGMARQSADELQGPLSSIGGWIDLLEERGRRDPEVLAMAAHMRADLDRLDRVAQRVERVGAEPAREAVDPSAVVDRVARYFRARVPTLAHSFVIDVEPTVGSPRVTADPVLLEWVVELLVQHALDALAGRGGRITLSVGEAPAGGCRIRVADDGPGGRAEPLAATAGAGWMAGAGVDLARRIVEGHQIGRLLSGSGDQGRAFDVIIE